MSEDLVDKSGKSGIDHLAALLCTVLLSDLGSIRSDISVSDELIEMSLPKSRPTSCDTRSETLPSGCILVRLQLVSYWRYDNLPNAVLPKGVIPKRRNSRIHLLLTDHFPRKVFFAFLASVIPGNGQTGNSKNTNCKVFYLAKMKAAANHSSRVGKVPAFLKDASGQNHSFHLI